MTFDELIDLWSSQVLYPYQRKWLFDLLSSKYTAILAARQVGKSYILALGAVILSYTDAQNILIISESQDKAVNIIKEVLEHIRVIETLTGLKVHDSRRSGNMNVTMLTPRGPRTIIARPGHPSALQGYTGTVMVDELSITRHDPEEMVAQALSVSSAKPEYKVVMCSNADKKNSFVHNFWYSEEESWLRRRESWSMSKVNIYDRFQVSENPKELPEHFQNIYNSMNRNLWRRFYENAFLEAGASRFAMEEYTRGERFNILYGDITVGFDPGYTINPTGLVCIETKDNKVNVLAARKLYRVEVADQLEMLSEWVKTYKPRRIVIDAGGAIPIVQELKRTYGKLIVEKSVNNSFYETTTEKLDYLLSTDSIYLGTNRELYNELQKVEMDGTRIILPEWKPSPLPHPDAKDHCDLVVGLLLALTQLENRTARAYQTHTHIPQGPRFFKG